MKCWVLWHTEWYSDLVPRLACVFSTKEQAKAVLKMVIDHFTNDSDNYYVVYVDNDGVAHKKCNICGTELSATGSLAHDKYLRKWCISEQCLDLGMCDDLINKIMEEMLK